MEEHSVDKIVFLTNSRPYRNRYRFPGHRLPRLQQRSDTHQCLRHAHGVNRPAPGDA
jgi:hypothetical protein